MQVATDLADGLDYIHNNTGQTINLIHKYVKSTSVIVTEPSFNAKICHFGTAELCGEVAIELNNGELKRSELQFEGVMGYMSPDFQSTGIATQKSDVYAFGVILLELLSGEEPLKYKLDRNTGDYIKLSIIASAIDVVDGAALPVELDGRLRRWIDRRLRDSFPVDVAEKMRRIALDCVQVDPDNRPNMRRVANKISKLYLDSKKWSDKVRIPTEFSASFAPR
jgi:serine/threonine protein kinase